jgi:transformation/transcription domain-associated protein
LDPPLLLLSTEILEIINRAWLLFLRIKEEPQLVIIDAEKRTQMSLKMECMKLIKQALVMPEMSSNARNHDIRDKIIETFFSSLSSVNDEIIAIAKAGLSQFVLEQKVPRELLQKSLRPVLSNLGNYSKLTIPVLQTLEHLLELCTSYFSVKLGEQLVEHLKAWTHPQKIQHLEKNDITKAAANILHLFSFLPKDSVKFLSGLVNLTLQLEKAWKSNFSEYSSPFRKPLQKYLSFYPEETVDHFLGSKGAIFKIDEAFNLFLSILKLDNEQLIKNYIIQNPDCLLFSSRNITNEMNEEQKLSVHQKFLKIVHCLCQKDQDILTKSKNKKILNEIRKIWSEITMFNSITEPIPFNSPFIEVPKLILKIFIKYCLIDEVFLYFLTIHRTKLKFCF